MNLFVLFQSKSVVPVMSTIRVRMFSHLQNSESNCETVWTEKSQSLFRIIINPKPNRNPNPNTNINTNTI